MKKFSASKLGLAAAISILTFCGASAFAELEKAGYDPYVQELAYPDRESGLKKIAASLPAYPFELVRWPVNKTLFFLEDYKVPSKTRYVLEKLDDQGLTPTVTFPVQGMTADLPVLLHLDDNLPSNIEAKTWVKYGHDDLFETGTRMGLSPADEFGLRALGSVNYKQRPEEFFYGIGPESSAGEGTSYKIESTVIEGRAGYKAGSTMTLDARAAYSNINITDGKDRHRGLIDTTFAGQNIPGLDGDEILTTGLEFNWTPPHSQEKEFGGLPGKIRLAADFNEGLGNSEARYFKLIADIGDDIQLGSPKRVFAIRLYGESNNPLNNHEVPFHQMARLGGFGTFSRASQTLRAFDPNRFTDENAVLLNLEYRYQVYEYRSWTVTQVIFLDEGQVFNSFGQFQFQDFEASYGLGLRFSFLQRVLLDIEMAHGNEGTVFYFKNRKPF